MYELQGKILEIKDTQVFKNDFTKREFIVDNGAKFQNTVKFELVKDDCSMIDKFSVGDDVKVSFYINGSAWEDKHFVNLSVNKIESVGAAAGGASVQKPAHAGTQVSDNEADDLPFIQGSR